MLRVLLTAAALVLAVPAVADAERMPAPPRVVIHNEPCPDSGGSCSYEGTDDVFLEAGASRFERQHELGHQFDRQVLTAGNRQWLTPRLGFASGPWDRGTGNECGRCGPDEVFADAYAACALGMNPVPHRSRSGLFVSRWTTSYGWHPTIQQHRVICNAIAFLGAAYVQ